MIREFQEKQPIADLPATPEAGQIAAKTEMPAAGNSAPLCGAEPAAEEVYAPVKKEAQPVAKKEKSFMEKIFGSRSK